jgi:diguanylate cyclase (GGDEF)-like protein/PAS domain S-box-containing protein
MTERYVCPCCGESLLVHIRGNNQVGFCLNCYQEMPLIRGYQKAEIEISKNCELYASDFINSLLKNNHNVHEMVQSSIDGMWVISPDQTTLFTNQKLAEILGYTVTEMQTKPFWKFIHEPHPICQIFNANQSLNQPEEYELKLLHREGYWIWVKLSIMSLMDEKSECQGYLLRVLDLTDLKQIEHQLRQQQKREEALNHLLKVIRTSSHLQTIFKATVEQLGDVFPVASAQIVQYLPTNQTWINRAEYQKQINGLTGSNRVKMALNSAEYHDPIPTQRITVIDSEKISLPLKVSTAKSQNSVLVIDDQQVEEFLQYYPGAWLPIPLYCESSIWGCLSLIMQDPKYCWQTRDQTFIQSVADQLSIAIDQAKLYQELEQARLKFQTLSTLDPLTQLPNCYCFNQNLNQTWQQLSADGGHLTLILCHVDRFLSYKKTDGNSTANECLKQIAFILRSSLTHRDQMVARYSQNEFVLLLPHTQTPAAVKLIETVQTQIEQLQVSPSSGNQGLTSRVSFGMASLRPQVGLSPQQLLANAEQALDQGASPFCKCLLA